MTSRPIEIKVTKHKISKEMRESGHLVQLIYVQATIGEDEVGQIVAHEIDMPKIAEMGLFTISDVMGSTPAFEELCGFAYGQLSAMLPEFYLLKRKRLFNHAFAKLVKSFGYQKPAPYQSASDFDYKLMLVESVSVNPECRNLGIGTRMMASLGKSKKTHREDGKAMFIALRAYPTDGTFAAYENDPARRDEVFLQELEQVKSFYGRLGFVAQAWPTRMHWMVSTPNEIYHRTKRLH